MRRFRQIVFGVIWVLVSFRCFAQDTHPVSWKFSSGQIAPLTYKMRFIATVKSPYHIYPLQSLDGGLGMPTSFLFDEDAEVELVGDMEEKGAEKSEGRAAAYYSKGVTFTQTVKVKSEKVTTLSFTIKYMACTNLMCLPPSSKKFTVALKKQDGTAVAEKSAVPSLGVDKSTHALTYEDFMMADTARKLISSKDIRLKAKYTFIDFWASWCAPCRVQGRQLIPMYEKYKSMGFNVLGVSLDTDSLAWKKAIQADKYTWINLCDGKGLTSPIAKRYEITAIPRNFIIDSKGQIVAKDLHGKELEAKLEELFSGDNGL